MPRPPGWLMRRFWDAHSRGWEQVASGAEPTGRRKELVDAVCGMVPVGAAVVDLGCGPGLLAVELAERGLRVTATDFSPAMIDRARRRAAEWGVPLSLESLDLDEAFPWPAATFDGAVSVYVLQMLRDPLAFLSKVVGIVRPGGAVVVEVPGQPSGRASLPDLGIRDRVLNEVKRAAAHLPGGVRWYEVEDLRRLAEAAGLTNIGLTTQGRSRRLLGRVDS